MPLTWHRVPFWLLLVVMALLTGLLTQITWVYAYATIDMEHVGGSYWGDEDDNPSDTYYYFQWTPTHDLSANDYINNQAYFINEGNQDNAYRYTVAYDRDRVRFTNTIWSLYGCETYTEQNIVIGSAGVRTLTVRWGDLVDPPVAPDGCAGGQLRFRWEGGDSAYDWRHLVYSGNTLLFHAGESCAVCGVRVASDDTVRIH